MKIIKAILIIALIALIVIQFIPVDKNLQDNYASILKFEEETHMPKEVKVVMRKDCYDCHSNHTIYPWYAKIAPANMYLASHIEEGNEHFNASKWDSYSLKKKDHKLEELIEEVEEGEMPLDSYTWIHGDLTETERQAVLDWAASARQLLSKR